MVDETEYITLKAGTIHHAGGCSVKVVEDFGAGGVALSKVYREGLYKDVTVV